MLCLKRYHTSTIKKQFLGLNRAVSVGKRLNAFSGSSTLDRSARNLIVLIHEEKQSNDLNGHEFAK
jgi:hypothetical protein